MKLRTLILFSFLSGTLFTSCKKDPADTLDPNTPVKYLSQTDGYAVSDGEVITSHTFYRYDDNNRLLSRHLQTYTDNVLDGDDSLVFVYPGAGESPSTVKHYDLTDNSEETVFLYYNAGGDLIKDSVEDNSSTYYTYDGTKTYVTHNAYGYTTSDVLTTNTEGNITTATTGESATSYFTLTFQFNKNILSPWWFNGSIVSRFMVAHEDDVEGILAPYGKNIFTKMMVKYVDTDPVDPINETNTVSLNYENINGGYPGKMTMTDPTQPGTAYQLTFTYK